MNDWTLLEAMLEREPSVATKTVDNEGNTLLHLFARSTVPLTLVTNLMRMPEVEVNSLNSAGFTPLLMALKHEKLSIARLLLSCERIKPCISGSEKISVLALALHALIEEELWDKFWDGKQSTLRCSDECGWTPLHIAAVRRDAKLANWILSKSSYRERSKLWAIEDKLRRTPDYYGLHKKARGAEAVVNKIDSEPVRSWDSGLRWTVPNHVNRSKILEAILPIDGKLMASDRIVVHGTSLPFYDSQRVQLLRITNPDWPLPVQAYYMQFADGELKRLDGNSPPIHYTNAMVPLKITPAVVLDYLRFFCFFLRIDGLPFLIIEGTEQKEVPSNLPSGDTRLVESFARPARHEVTDLSFALYPVSAVVWYSNRLGFCLFNVSGDGGVEINLDLPLTRSMSARVSAPIRAWF